MILQSFRLSRLSVYILPGRNSEIWAQSAPKGVLGSSICLGGVASGSIKSSLVSFFFESVFEVCLKTQILEFCYMSVCYSIAVGDLWAKFNSFRLLKPVLTLSLKTTWPLKRNTL